MYIYIYSLHTDSPPFTHDVTPHSAKAKPIIQFQERTVEAGAV